MDIDIDLSTTFKAESVFPTVIRASMLEDGTLKKHPVGVYFQNIAQDPITKLASIPYKDAEEYGYYKVDMLHLRVLDHFESKDEVRAVLNRKVKWEMLEEREIVERLFHLSKHFDTVYAVKPKNELELADVLALIRPGKIRLLSKYLKDKTATRTELYTKRATGDFRKSHAVSYAMVITLQMNLLDMGVEI